MDRGKSQRHVMIARPGFYLMLKYHTLELFTTQSCVLSDNMNYYSYTLYLKEPLNIFKYVSIGNAPTPCEQQHFITHGPIENIRDLRRPKSRF